MAAQIPTIILIGGRRGSTTVALALLVDKIFSVDILPAQIINKSTGIGIVCRS